MTLLRTAAIVLSFVLSLGLSLGTGCGGSREPVAPPAPAPSAAPEAPPSAAAAAADPALPTAPGDAVGVETQKLVDRYWELMGAGEVAAIAPLLGEQMATQFENLRKQRGDAAVSELLKGQYRWGTLGPGNKVSDDEYLVPCRTRRYRVKMSLRVKKIGAQWRLVEQRADRPPQNP